MWYLTHHNKLSSNKLFVACVRLLWVAILLGVLQQCGSVLGGRVVLGVAQPALSVVLNPVCPMAVAQQEEVGLLSVQQQTGSCNTKDNYSPMMSGVWSVLPVVPATSRNFLLIALAGSDRLSTHLCFLPVQSRSSWRVSPTWFPLNLLAEQPPPPSAKEGLEPHLSWPGYAPVMETNSHKCHLLFLSQSLCLDLDGRKSEVKETMCWAAKYSALKKYGNSKEKFCILKMGVVETNCAML